MSTDGKQRVHSGGWGVFKSHLANGPAVVYRAPSGHLRKPNSIGWEADNIAQQWVDHVGYSKKSYAIFDEKPRAFYAAFGSHTFGKGARSRLLKYRKRGNRPNEKSPWWIPLDA